MSRDPVVSVVTATYNMGQYLPEAVRSVLNQTYSALQLHVIDDGSTDGTGEVMRPFLADPRVRYDAQTNEGQTKAKNRGILAAAGDYVAFLDADDVWMPNKLEKQLPLFGASPVVGVVYSDVTHIDANGTPVPKGSKRRYYDGDITKRLFVDNFINFSSAVVRRECFTTCGVFDETLAMSIDWDLWLRISTRYQFALLDEPTFCYRIWPGQMSRNLRQRYECIVRIMSAFERDHSDLLDRGTRRTAWADTYTHRGTVARRSDGEVREAFGFIVRALTVQPLFMPAWKELAKLALRRRI